MTIFDWDGGWATAPHFIMTKEQADGLTTKDIGRRVWAPVTFSLDLKNIRRGWAEAFITQLDPVKVLFTLGGATFEAPVDQVELLIPEEPGKAIIVG